MVSYCKKPCKLWSEPIINQKMKSIQKNKKYTQLLSLSTLFKLCWLVHVPFEVLQANNFILWASVIVLDFLNQQGNFATSVTWVTKLNLAAKAAFIHKIPYCEIHVYNTFLLIGWQDLTRGRSCRQICSKPKPRDHIWPSQRYHWKLPLFF